MKIALDAMGGDHAPAVVIDGAIMALREIPDLHIILVGNQDRIQQELARHQIDGLPLTIHHADEVVEMTDHVDAVKAKPNSSMRVGLRLVKSGEADAFVSAGNSGGVMAAAIFELGRIRGIRRPALATVYPVAPTPILLIDMGANTDCKPEYLLQFAYMGATYLERVWGIPNPRVGIVSNGEEPDKGSLIVREAFQLLQASPLNFIGNVEGKDITRGMADVVVTDGFTGNVIVKLTEGIVIFLARFLKEQFTSGWFNRLALLLMIPGLLLMTPALLLLLPTIRRIARSMDYAEYGGAYLLGVNGVVVIGHGRSNAKAIKNAVRVACEAIQGRLLETMRESLPTIVMEKLKEERDESTTG